MDGVFTCYDYSLINELTQGREHSKQLRTYLSSVASPSGAIPELLLHKILSSYEQSLIILKWRDSTVQSLPAAGAIKSMVSGEQSLPAAGPIKSMVSGKQSLPEAGPIKSMVSGEQSLPAAGAIESMVSGDGNPRSDEKERSYKDHQKIIHISKKRKSQFTELVRVSTAEGLPDDGYSWIKYGQKYIVGTNFPRGYYRCKFRLIENCRATKQIQRSDVEPFVFEITYKGYHTCQCRQVTNSTHQATSLEKQANHPSLIDGSYSPSFISAEGGFDSFEGPIDGGYSWRKYGEKDILGAKYRRSFYRCTYRNMENCRATKEVQRSDDDPTAFEIVYEGSHTCHLATNSAQEATSPEKEASDHSLIVGGYSPSFVSPKTPESNYFSVSSCQMNGLGIVHNLDHSESYLSDIGIFCELRHSDSDRTDTFSGNTSTTSSSIGGQVAIVAGARHDFSIWTKRHSQTEANTPKKNDKDE